jgi:non-ribosomal peptide synthetase component F
LWWAAREGLIGFFANSLPVAADLSDDPSFDDIVARARAAVLDAHAHREVPFDDIVRAVSPPRLPGHNPIFQVWFDLIGAGPADGGLVLPGVDTRPFHDSRARTRFDLELHLTESASGELTGRLLYAVDLLDRSTAEEIAGHYQGFLRAVARRPATRLSEVDFFAADELAVILGDWGAARP